MPQQVKKETSLKKRVMELEDMLEKAETSSKIKSAYLENMSHEIRTSMNGIVGMTSLVLETDLTQEQERYLKMVNSSVDRLLEVVNEVLDYSKIEAGLLELEPQDFSLKECLDHDLYLQNISARQKGLDLTCEIDSDVPEFLHGDPKRLVQVVTILVANGIRHTQEGGVAISIKSDGYDESGRISLSFSIQDSGSGMDLEKQKRIFQAFCQTGSPGVLTHSGVGVGLTVCSQLVRMMGGEIGLASSDRGTSFWFSLPFKEVVDTDLDFEVDNLQEQRRAETIHYALKGAKVLLAEDEPINSVLTTTILTQAGMDVVTVANGAEALEKCREQDFDIILMDVQMPVVDGLQATRDIRLEEKHHKQKRKTVIALTALAMQGDREKCLQAGMDDYLAKPLDKGELLEMLSKYLTSSALVVDGDLESQSVMVRSLVENGWEVTIAETGRSAMYEASLNSFDVIFLDTQASQIDSFEAARIIRRLEEYSGQHAYLVGIGPGEHGEEQKCAANGIDGYIQRPVTREKIAEKIREAVS